MKLSIIVSAYNEGKHIGKNLQMLLEVLSMSGVSYEIIVVSDGSQDNTVEEALKMTTSRKVKVYDYPSNRGKGYAMKYGFERSIGEYVVFIDADLDLNPASINTFIDILLINNLEIVIGSKWHPDSVVFYPLHRRWMSRAYNMLVNVLFHTTLHDTQVGLKLYKRSVLSKIAHHAQSTSFTYDLELLVLARHFGFKKIQEAPIVLNYKSGGSTVKFRNIFKTLCETFNIYFNLYIAHAYDEKQLTHSSVQLEGY